jgi:toxin CptA
MYNAPAVSYPVGRSHFKRLITGALMLLAWAVLGVWCHQAPRLGWPQGLGVGVWLLALGLAVRDASQSPQGHLSWDGQEWHWASAGPSRLVEVRPQLDAQSWILLALSGAQTGLRTDQNWLWLERTNDPLQWDALRRAVWAHGRHGLTRQGGHPGIVLNQP